MLIWKIDESRKRLRNERRLPIFTDVLAIVFT